MELLKIRENRPYKTQDKIEFNRDLCCLSFTENGEWGLLINNQETKGKGLNDLKETLKELRQLKQKTHRGNTTRRLVIWTNHLNLYKDVIILACGKNSNFTERTTNSFKGKFLMWINDQDFEFRNFNIIAGESAKRIGETYNYKGSENEIMKIYIENQSEKNWSKFRYTAAHCFEKLFEKKLQDFTTEEQKHQIHSEMKQRNNKGNKLFNTWIRRASLSGFIWTNSNTNRKVVNDVYSFDIHQAYGGQFVRANDFPLGEIVITTMPKEEVMKQNWYCFVFEFSTMPKQVLPWSVAHHDEETGNYYLTMEKWDIECMRILGTKFTERPKIKYQFICKRVGYLNYGVRNLYNNLYLERQELKEKKDKTQKIIKQILEVNYGKGLQDRDVTYHYFCPQISYHALAKTRYELITMMGKLNSNTACDSDSIKTTDRKSKEIFNQRNQEIKQELAAAGFTNTDIGTWKFEGNYSRFIQFEKKVYAYEENGELVCKFAGCNREGVEQFLANGGDMDGLLNCLSIPGGVIQKKLKLDVNNGLFAVETIYRDYSLDKDAMAAFLQRQKIICNVA